MRVASIRVDSSSIRDSVRRYDWISVESISASC
jgi:hypothetical protein